MRIAQQRTAAQFGIHAESPCLLGNDPAFGTLNLKHGCLVSHRAATAVRTRWATDYENLDHRSSLVDIARLHCCAR
jgi:hypothetical protein